MRYKKINTVLNKIYIIRNRWLLTSSTDYCNEGTISYNSYCATSNSDITSCQLTDWDLYSSANLCYSDYCADNTNTLQPTTNPISQPTNDPITSSTIAALPTVSPAKTETPDLYVNGYDIDYFDGIYSVINSNYGVSGYFLYYNRVIGFYFCHNSVRYVLNTIMCCILN